MSFALFLFLLLSVTGVVWLLDKYFLRRRRAGDARQPWSGANGSERSVRHGGIAGA